MAEFKLGFKKIEYDIFTKENNTNLSGIIIIIKIKENCINLLILTFKFIIFINKKFS